MTLQEFFDSDILALPKSRGLADYHQTLNSVFALYRHEIANLSTTDAVSTAIKANISLVQNLTSATLSAVAAYLSGHPEQAYNLLAAGLAAVNTQLLLLRMPDQSPNDILSSLYRMRTGVGEPFTRSEMFHIPFQLRHKVTTQRYSIPGLPCLYLGGSTYVCWVEMGKPALDQLQVAKFRVRPGKAPAILNLSIRPELAADAFRTESAKAPLNQEFIDYFAAYLTCWPLLAAAAYRVPDRDAHFKVEYIIPQLLLQWVTANHHYDGLRYFSTHIAARIPAPIASNYVFPVRDRLPTGLCNHLADLFEMTDVVRWDLVAASRGGGKVSSMQNFDIELMPGVRTHYRNTDFGDVELQMTQLPWKNVV